MRKPIMFPVLAAFTISTVSCGVSGADECDTNFSTEHCFADVTVGQFHQMVKNAGNPPSVVYVLPESVERSVRKSSPSKSLYDDAAYNFSLIPEGYSVQTVVEVTGSPDSSKLITIIFTKN